MVMVQSAAPPDRQHVIRVRRAASGLALEGPSSGLLSMSLHGPPSEVLCKVTGTGLLSTMSMQGTASGLLCKGAVRLLSIPLQGTASGLLCKGAVVGKIHREIHGMAMEGAMLSMQALPNASGLVQPRDPRHCWKNCCQGTPRYTAPPSSFAFHSTSSESLLERPVSRLTSSSCPSFSPPTISHFPFHGSHSTGLSPQSSSLPHAGHGPHTDFIHMAHCRARGPRNELEPNWLRTRPIVFEMW